MTDRERLLEILNVPIYTHENVYPLEAVVDYLLDNGVRIPVLCKDCKSKHEYSSNHFYCYLTGMPIDEDDFCSYGERKDND